MERQPIDLIPLNYTTPRFIFEFPETFEHLCRHIRKYIIQVGFRTKAEFFDFVASPSGAIWKKAFNCYLDVACDVNHRPEHWEVIVEAVVKNGTFTAQELTILVGAGVSFVPREPYNKVFTQYGPLVRSVVGDPIRVEDEATILAEFYHDYADRLGGLRSRGTAGAGGGCYTVQSALSPTEHQDGSATGAPLRPGGSDAYGGSAAGKLVGGGGGDLAQDWGAGGQV